jgi:hypothetical protein
MSIQIPQIPKNRSAQVDAPVQAGPTYTPSNETRQMTVEDVKALVLQGKFEEAQSELDKLNFFRELRTHEKEAEKDKTELISREQRVRQAKQMAEEAYRNAEAQAHAHKMCEMNGHKRPNGTSALVGQKDSRGVLHTTCQRCQMNYSDIGTGKGMLPHHIAAFLEQDSIGGVF